LSVLPLCYMVGNTVFTKWEVDPSMVEDFSVASLDVLEAVDDVGVDRRFDFKAT
jgi:hypothetical protein